jgi:hypothetical protein
VRAGAQLAHRFSGRATLSGVGFFDRPHGRTGVAPNGIEMHPVLAFTKAHDAESALTDWTNV